jgi:hypothetical protein
MPSFEVLEVSFIGDRIRQPGEIVEFDGIPGPNLKALDGAGKAKEAEYKAAETESVDRLHAAAETGDPGNAKKAKKAA